MLLIAHVVAGWTNYVLAAFLLVEIVRWRDPRRWTFLAACALGIGVSVGLAEMGKHILSYPDPRGFPSGHETFAVSTLTCLIWRDRRWVWPAVPLAIVMAAALVIAHYHRTVDVVGAILLSPLTASAVLSSWRHRFGMPAKIRDL